MKLFIYFFLYIFKRQTFDKKEEKKKENWNLRYDKKNERSNEYLIKRRKEVRKLKFKIW